MVTTLGKSVKTFAMFMALSAVLSSCTKDEAECKRELRRIDNIVRVFMHGPNSYSFLIHFSDSADGHPIFDTVSFQHFSPGHLLFFDSIVIVADVAPEDDMWAQSTFARVTSSCHYTAEIHVHAPADINGGGWNHGKFGSGQTTVVE
ncbi:MAG: hypothetical protein AAB692_00360 [Patescibacteria group bacterium]